MSESYERLKAQKDALVERERNRIRVAAYNRGVDDAKDAIRQHRCGDEDGYYKPCFITAIARYCGPERAAIATTTNESEQS